MTTTSRFHRSTVSGQQLKLYGLRDTTVQRYRKGVQAFLTFLHNHLHIHQPHDQPTTAEDFDELYCEYMAYSYDNNISYGLITDGFFGLQFFLPLTKHRLPESSLMLKGWRRLEPTESRPPITWEVVVVLCCTMIKNGYVEHGIATLCAFDMYLRIGEFLQLRVCDVATPHDPRLGSAYTRAAIRLARTKTGRNQFVTLNNHDVSRLLHLQCLVRPSTRSLVFGFTRNGYRAVFQRCLDALGLGSIGYTPHSLRHGGATRDFLLGKSIDDILFRGRWEANKSAKTYVQSARALLLQVQIPQQIHQTGLILSNNLYDNLLPLLPPTYQQLSSLTLSQSHMVKGGTTQ